MVSMGCPYLVKGLPLTGLWDGSVVFVFAFLFACLFVLVLSFK